jgi:hypothetical protein
MANKLGKVVLSMVVMASALTALFGFAAARPASAQTSDAWVRVLHGSPDAPAVDVYVNGTKAFSNLAFKSVTDWAKLPAGSYDVKVTAAGATDAVIQATLPLEGGKYYTVVAVGKLADIKAEVVMDNLSAIESGKARLRVFHGSPDAPAVDVAVTGGPVLVSNLSFPNASDNLDVAAGTYDVEVRPAGTTTAALSAPGVSLQEGKLYTVYALGLLAGDPALGLVPVVDNLTMAPPTSMPQTGAADNMLWLAALALLLAMITISVGVVARVRAR